MFKVERSPTKPSGVDSRSSNREVLLPGNARGVVVAGGTHLYGLRLPDGGFPQAQVIIGFWKGALGATPSGAPVITFDWYRGFIQFLMDTNSAGWFSYVIVFGELAVGIGLILGAFVGLAAAGGLLMNLAFMLAGTTSTNPLFEMLGVLLILALKNAGYFGLDYYLPPLLGTPWKQTPPVTTRAVANNYVDSNSRTNRQRSAADTTRSTRTLVRMGDAIRTWAHRNGAAHSGANLQVSRLCGPALARPDLPYHRVQQ
jgi:hypothetical protein